jgi:hypothetical protein
MNPIQINPNINHNFNSNSNLNSNSSSNRNPCVVNFHEETNKRIYDRNIPSQLLQPYLDVRPVLTKYSYLPIVDPRKEDKVRLMQMPTYNINTTFNPGNTQSPWSGFATQINVESELRNQIYALQKCSQSVYVPNSSSDLYNFSFTPNNSSSSNSHSLLFQKSQFNDFNPNPQPKIIGSELFNNSTRTQLKEIEDYKPNCN